MSDKRYPPSSYAARYPYNQKQVTQSGIELELDDTPGHERVRLAHPSGTHFEYSANGRVTEVTVAGRIEYIKGGLTQTVDDNADVKVGGSTRESVSGDSHREVAGHETSMTQGDRREVIGGDHVAAVGGDHVFGVQGKCVLKYGGGLQLKFDGAKSDHTTVNAISDVAADVQFGQTLDVHALRDVTIKSDTRITLQVGGSRLVIEDGVIYLDTSKLYLGGTPDTATRPVSASGTVTTDGASDVSNFLKRVFGV